ncbi:MAG TPA: nucleotide exchange factor GrpE [Ktedonobacteraceae bacterium]|nr:nucleotide exchange factor GrpE [Ktedonobacteraceae bacterium]
MLEESQDMTNTQAEQEAKTVNAGGNGTADAPGDKDALIAQLEAQLSQARQEAAENWNRFLRERAEMDNFRKRQERLLADRVQHQKKALLQKLLGVQDNVERALIYQDTLDRQGLQQALRMMQWQLGEVLRGEGLTPVPSVGETFNPYVHEAIEAVEDSDQPEGTVVEEVLKGYKLGDETLRAAHVKVSRGNKPNASSSEAQS